MKLKKIEVKTTVKVKLKPKDGAIVISPSGDVTAYQPTDFGNGLEASEGLVILTTLAWIVSSPILLEEMIDRLHKHMAQS